MDTGEKIIRYLVQNQGIAKSTIQIQDEMDNYTQTVSNALGKIMSFPLVRVYFRKRKLCKNGESYEFIGNSYDMDQIIEQFNKDNKGRKDSDKERRIKKYKEKGIFTDEKKIETIYKQEYTKFGANVPKEVHRAFKANVALKGRTINEVISSLLIKYNKGEIND